MDLGVKHGTIINHDSRERGLVIWVKASCPMLFTHCRDLQPAFLSTVKEPIFNEIGIQYPVKTMTTIYTTIHMSVVHPFAFQYCINPMFDY